jgi:hypothetical protein
MGSERESGDHTPVTRCEDETEEASPRGLQAVEIARTSRANAEAARVRLERTGLACEIRGVEGTAAADGEASIWVAEDVEDLAREALAEVEEDDGDIDAIDREDPADAEARLAANWVCPRCRESGLVLTPLPVRWMHLRVICVGAVLLPLLLTILGTLIPELSRTVAESQGALCVTTFAAGLALALSLVLPNREKWCRACGWRAGPRHEG